MHDNGVTLQKKVLQNLDIPYSYELAKRMEQYRSHPTLGYRPAGSKAEFETGEMLKTEMEKIGLSEVTKDAVTVDGWEFHKAALSYTNAVGETVSAELGAYQTTFVTDGPKEFSMMYLGKGTETDYQGKDVRDKLVLVEINQRDEWWINYPVYQAHLKGAAALIAVQSGGYGEIDDEALNAQDIAGPEDAPAFSISRKDAAGLLELLRDQEEITVTFDAESRVTRNCTTYNIVGRIPGKHPDRMVLLSAHYDSYFDGFQDDNTAVALMFGIAKALRDSGFQPNNTIVICAMASEEWGVVDSNFDWSTGAYEQIFTAHPEWVGKVIADLNFELPALAHGTRARIRSCYEYVSFLEEYLADLTANNIQYDKFPFATWAKIMRQTLTDYDTSLLKTVPFNGVEKLRVAIAEHLYRYRGMQVSPDHIIVGAGTEYLYSRLLQLLGKNAKFGVENPGYRKITKLYEVGGVAWDYVDIDGQGMKVEQLKQKGITVAHVSPEHHFPIGLVMPVGRRQELLRWAAEEPERYIVEDDFDCEFRMVGKPIPSVQSMDRNHRVIYINTFSKTMVPSLRIGYMVLPEKLMERYISTMNFYSCTVSGFEQYAMAAFLEQGYFERHIRRLINDYRGQRERICRMFRKSPLSRISQIYQDDAGTHFLLHVRTDLSDVEIKWAARQRGILVNCLSEYCFADTQKYRGILVIHYSDMEDEVLQKVIGALEEIFL